MVNSRGIDFTRGLDWLGVIYEETLISSCTPIIFNPLASAINTQSLLYQSPNNSRRAGLFFKEIFILTRDAAVDTNNVIDWLAIQDIATSLSL